MPELCKPDEDLVKCKWTRHSQLQQIQDLSPQHLKGYNFNILAGKGFHFVSVFPGMALHGDRVKISTGQGSEHMQETLCPIGVIFSQVTLRVGLEGLHFINDLPVFAALEVKQDLNDQQQNITAAFVFFHDRHFIEELGHPETTGTADIQKGCIGFNDFPVLTYGWVMPVFDAARDGLLYEVMAARV